MAQKIIELVGISTESFDKAAENALQEAAKTVRGIKWVRIRGLEMAVSESKVIQYRTTARIYFDVQH